MRLVQGKDASGSAVRTAASVATPGALIHRCRLLIVPGVATVPGGAGWREVNGPGPSLPLDVVGSRYPTSAQSKSVDSGASQNSPVVGVSARLLNEHKCSLQRDGCPRLVWERLVRLEELVKDVVIGPDSEARRICLTKLLSLGSQSSPGDEQCLIGMVVVDGPLKLVDDWHTLGRSSALDFDNESRRVKPERTAASQNVDSEVTARRRDIAGVAVGTQDVGNESRERMTGKVLDDVRTHTIAYDLQRHRGRGIYVTLLSIVDRNRRNWYSAGTRIRTPFQDSEQTGGCIVPRGSEDGHRAVHDVEKVVVQGGTGNVRAFPVDSNGMPSVLRLICEVSVTLPTDSKSEPLGGLQGKDDQVSLLDDGTESPHLPDKVRDPPRGCASHHSLGDLANRLARGCVRQVSKLNEAATGEPVRKRPGVSLSHHSRSDDPCSDLSHGYLLGTAFSRATSIPAPSREVQVDDDGRVVTPRLDGRLVRVLNAGHVELRADPHGVVPAIEATLTSPAPSSKGDGERSVGSHGGDARELFGLVGEPTSECIVEIVGLARPPQEVIARRAIQSAGAGMPVGAGKGKVKGVDLRGIGVSSENDRAVFCRQPLGELDSLADLHQLPGDTRRSVVRGEGQDAVARADASCQRTLGEVGRAGGQQLRIGSLPAPDRDGETATGSCIERVSVQRGTEPVEVGSLAKRVDAGRIDLLKEDEVRRRFERSQELPKSTSGVTDPVVHVPGDHSHGSKVILAATS